MASVCRRPDATSRSGQKMKKPTPDTVNHPKHYVSSPSGVECITVIEHMSFCLGNAIKYIWRADEKGNALEDLRKAAWYIAREIERRTKALK